MDGGDGGCKEAYDASRPATSEPRSDAHDAQPIPEKQESISERAFVDRIDKSDRWMIVLTAAIAFTGIVTGVIFGKQLTVMQGQLDAMEADQRPWVYISKPIIEEPGLKFIPEGAYINLTFVLKNVGKTPARHVVTPGRIRVVNQAEYNLPDWGECNKRRSSPSDKLADGIVLFPSEEGPFRTHFGIPTEQVIKLKQAGNTVIINGCVDYLSSDGRHHSTLYFFEITKKGPNGTFLPIDVDNPPIGASAFELAINPYIGREAD